MVDYLLGNTVFEVFGGARRLSVPNHNNIDYLHFDPRFHVINFDLTDAHSISQAVSQLKPDYFINFAAQSFVKSSWDFPAQTWETNTTSIIHILEAIRLHSPKCRFYNAGSSEEFGDVIYSPQDEQHPLRPRSPYAASKAAARQIVKVYRESYGLYAIQGWLFNHEGTRRGEEFVTRKISKGAAEAFRSMAAHQPVAAIELGYLDAKRDWSDASDCVDAVWRMLNQEKYCEKPGGSVVGNLSEYVVSSDENHSVREFVERAFSVRTIIPKPTWEGKGLDEKYVWDDQILVKVNPGFYRPAEVECLLGNSSRIRKELGWQPKVSFDRLVEKMVLHDLARIDPVPKYPDVGVQ